MVGYLGKTQEKVNVIVQKARGAGVDGNKIVQVRATFLGFRVLLDSRMSRQGFPSYPELRQHSLADVQNSTLVTKVFGSCSESTLEIA